MTPIELWIDGLENRYWSISGRLRGPIDDPQICGDGFCALGVLCDLFLKHAPEEAARAKARWDKMRGAFIWEEDGLEHAQTTEVRVPGPVQAWWNRSHAISLGAVMGENDTGRSFRELAMYLRGAAGLHYAKRGTS